jgi:hypothetical protein
VSRYAHITASGTLIGSDEGPLYLADLVLMSMPPQVGSGVEIAGVDASSLPSLQRHGDRFWIEHVVVSGHLNDGVVEADGVAIDGASVWRKPPRVTH